MRRPLLACLLAALPVLAEPGGLPASGRELPEDAFFYMEWDWRNWREQLDDSRIYALWNDPAMVAFRRPWTDRLQEQMGEGFREGLETIEIDGRADGLEARFKARLQEIIEKHELAPLDLVPGALGAWMREPRLDPDGEPGGMEIDTGRIFLSAELRDAARGVLEELMREGFPELAAAEEGTTIERFTHRGIEWLHATSEETGADGETERYEGSFGLHEDHLMFGMTANLPFAGRTAAIDPFLNDTRRRLAENPSFRRVTPAGGRPLALAYTHRSFFSEMFRQEGAFDDERERAEFEAGKQILGLSGLESAATSVTVEDGDFAVRTFLHYPEGATGIWSAFTPGRFESADLAPAGTDWFFGMRIDPAAAWNEMMTALRMSPDWEQIRDDMADFEEETGVPFEERLLPALGEECSLAVRFPETPGPMGFPIPELLAFYRIRDAATVKRVIDAAMADAPPGEILSEPFGETTLYSTPLPTGMGTALAPSWCLTRDWFVFGTSKESVKEALARGPAAPGLSADEKYRDALRRVPTDRAALVSYLDLPDGVRFGYQCLGIAAMFGGGAGFDPSTLPDVETVARYLRPAAGVMSVEPNGVFWQENASIPYGSSPYGMLLPGGFVYFRLRMGEEVAPAPGPRGIPPEGPRRGGKGE